MRQLPEGSYANATNLRTSAMFSVRLLLFGYDNDAALVTVYGSVLIKPIIDVRIHAAVANQEQIWGFNKSIN